MQLILARGGAVKERALTELQLLTVDDTAAKLGISGLRTVSPSISNESLYFTMSHKSACNSGDMRGRLSRAIYQLHKQATMNKLVESNIQLWRQQSSK